MEIKKLSEEELQKINQLRQEFASVYANIGLVQVKIKELEGENIVNYQQLEVLKQSETNLFDELKNTYGVGTVDLDTGEFKPTAE
jgi:hypothetical protein